MIVSLIYLASQTTHLSRFRIHQETESFLLSYLARSALELTKFERGHCLIAPLAHVLSLQISSHPALLVVPVLTSHPLPDRVLTRLVHGLVSLRHTSSMRQCIDCGTSSALFIPVRPALLTRNPSSPKCVSSGASSTGEHARAGGWAS